MIYLVRHGQSTWNRDGLLQGQTPHPPLTEPGRRQAARAGELIHARSAHVDVYVASDQVRARQTAEIIADGRPVVLDPRLRERHAGRLEGMTTAAGMAEVADFDWSDPAARLGGSGESARDVAERMAAVLGEYRDRTAVLVSHGDTIRLALGWWCGYAPAAAPWVAVASAAVFALAEPGSFLDLTAGTLPPA